MIKFKITNLHFMDIRVWFLPAIAFTNIISVNVKGLKISFYFLNYRFDIKLFRKEQL